MITVKDIDSEQEWNNIAVALEAHPLQLWGWGSVKSLHGWRAGRVAVYDGIKLVAGAQYLIKRLPGPFKPYVYMPRGPFGSHENKHIQAMTGHIAERYHPIVISSEPDTVGEQPWKGWQKSTNRILLARTATMDLRQPDDQLLATMSKKTRQYIRKAANEGVDVRETRSPQDLKRCYEIYKQTATRAGFALHDYSYYKDIKRLLGKNSPVYVAERQSEIVAFLWPIVSSGIAFELYGGMNEQGQKLRANYHLKWQVVQLLKSQGVQRYDVNGLLNDGVTTFKKGFIPEETQMSGTFDFPCSAPQYFVWNSLLPLLKRVVQAVRR